MTTSLPAGSAAETAIYTRIRKLGKAGRTICSVFLVFSVLAFVAAIYGILSGTVDVKANVGPVTVDVAKAPGPDGSAGAGGTGHLGPSPIPNLSKAGKTGLVAITAIGLGFWMVGLWLMRCLFGQFTRGEIFTSGTARLMKWLGVWSLIQVIGLNFNFLLSGLFLLALGWGMDLAASLKQEQELTV